MYYLQKILIQLLIIQKSKLFNSLLFKNSNIVHNIFTSVLYYLQKILIQLSIIQKSKILPKLFNSSLFKNSNIVHNIFTSVQFTKNFNLTFDYPKIQDILHHLT